MYPLKFKPIAVPKIWGGQRLAQLLNKGFKGDHIGESWELTDSDGRISTVADGPLEGQRLDALIDAYKADLIGEKNYRSHGDRFPLLIKFIDAHAPLSIQVHPSDQLAKRYHHPMGKSELWYVVHAEPDSELIVGFSRPIDAQTYIEHLESHTLDRILQKVKVHKGASFYLPAGRIHAIGAGIVLAEIQQNSTLTYRIYDYDRVDPQTGEKRALHTSLAMEALDFTSQAVSLEPLEDTARVMSCPHFKVGVSTLEGPVIRENRADSFVILIGVEGHTRLSVGEWITEIHFGETLLLPAKFKEFKLWPANGWSKVLDVTT